MFDKSTVSRANENRDWKIFQDYRMKLIQHAKELYIGTNQPTAKASKNVSFHNFNGHELT